MLAGLVLAAWSGLYAEGRAGRLALLCALAAAPAAARLHLPAVRRWALVPITALCALAVVVLAAPVSAGALLGLDGAAWSTAVHVVPHGLEAASAAVPPFSAAGEPALVALLDLVLAALLALLVWEVTVRRRPLAGVAAAGLALGYRWTVLAPDQAVLTGAVALAVVLAALAVGLLGRAEGSALGATGAGGAAVAGAALVAVAAGLGGGLGRGSSWLDWESWRLLGGEPAAAAGGFDLTQVYGQLSWPAKPRLVLRLRAGRSLPLRAATLDVFDGTAFTDSGIDTPQLLRREGDRVSLPVSRPAGTVVRQQITLVGVDSDVLLAGGQPIAFSGSLPTPLFLVGETVRAPSPLRRGDVYTAVSVVPSVRPAALARERRYVLDEVPDALRSLTISPHGAVLTVPVWGSGAPPPPASAFGQYADVARLARRLARGATSPYEVVSRIERYLRGGYAYDERPPLPPAGRAPLVDFLLHTRRGFCQHFAGAMALMLRTLGIPSRVAVGYTNGEYDPEKRTFDVYDRDAHSWVEVLFPSSGWLPFDPTPGRSVPNPASASSPSFQLPSTPAGAGGSAPRISLPDPPPPQPAGGTRAASPGGAAGGTTPWLWAGAGLAGALLVPAGARRIRRERRRRRGDERSRVLGALRELEGLAGDAGVRLAPALSPLERCAQLRDRLGVDAERLYRLALAARFAPAAPYAGAARAAWAELRRAERALRRRMGWRRRARAFVSVSSLRPSGFPSGRRARARATAGASSGSRAGAPSGTRPGIRPG